MMHPERIADYLEHIAQAINRATEYIQDLGNVDAFYDSQRAQDTVIRNIEIIGEAANRLTLNCPGSRCEACAIK